MEEIINTLVDATLGAQGEYGAVAVVNTIAEAGASVEAVSNAVPALHDAFCRPYPVRQKAWHDATREAIVGCPPWLMKVEAPTEPKRFARIIALLWVPQIYGDNRMREMVLNRGAADARAIIYQAMD